MLNYVIRFVDTVTQLQLPNSVQSDMTHCFIAIIIIISIIIIIDVAEQVANTLYLICLDVRLIHNTRFPTSVQASNNWDSLNIRISISS